MGQTLISVEPIWGKTYDIGFAGFTYHDESVLSSGIALFTALTSKIKVSHMILVYDQDYCLSAEPSGVEKKKLADYFDNEHCLIFFRKPVKWTPHRGELVVERAVERVGEKYDYGGLAAFFPRMLIPIQRLFFKSWLKKKALLSAGNAWFCSELCTDGFLAWNHWARSWLLSNYHPSKISPRAAFDFGDCAPRLWKPWRKTKLRKRIHSVEAKLNFSTV